jgi:4-carboxymuconolactone decarboxylase
MDRAEAGREIEERLFGDKAAAMNELMQELDPDVARWAEEFAFGEVWTREGLPYEERLIVAIVSLTVLGRMDQLRNYLFAALRADVPREKVQQAIAMTCVYAGFPAAMSGLVCWRDVQASHDRKQSS